MKEELEVFATSDDTQESEFDYYLRLLSDTSYELGTYHYSCRLTNKEKIQKAKSAKNLALEKLRGLFSEHIQ